MRGRRTFCFLGAALFALLALGCSQDNTWPSNHGGPKVVVSFAPLYCFAANVAGDDAVVKNVMTTSGPHDFNPSDVEARILRKADLFFINGVGLDNKLATTLQRGSGNRNLKVVDLGESVPAGKLLEGHHDHDHSHGHAHDHPQDPHIWLSPDLAVILTEKIRDELKAADPTHASNYDKRAAEYVDRLRKLKAEGLELLKAKADRRLVTFHESLGYFAEAFNLHIEGVVQKNPGVEPNTDELNQLITLCRKEKVRLIAVEPQYSSSTSAKVILDELARKQAVPDAAFVEIDPLETVVPAALTPDWYERKMRANLEALAKAMK